MNTPDQHAGQQPKYSNETKTPIRVADDEIVYNEFNGSDTFTKTIRCTYFIVVLFSTGSGVHSIDGVDHTVGPKQLHFLFPGQHHHWNVHHQTEASRIVVGHKVFETFSSKEIFHLIRHNPHPVFKLDDHAFHLVNHELGEIAELLRFERSDNTWRPLLSLRMDLLALIISREAQHYIQETVLKNASRLVQNFLALIDRHVASHNSVSWYAEQLGINMSYLGLLCRRDLNLTAKQLIDQRLLLAAKQRLRYSNQSIKEICFDLGFADASAFSNHFKKHTGFSPKEYQQ